MWFCALHLVKSFVVATLRSLQEAIEDRSAAVIALTAAQPRLDYNQALQGFESVTACCIASGMSNPLQLGWVNTTHMQQTMDIIKASMNLTSYINPSSLYTDRYLASP